MKASVSIVVLVAAVVGAIGIWKQASPPRSEPRTSMAVQSRLEELNNRAIAALRTILGDPDFVGAPARFAEPHDFVAALAQDEQRYNSKLRPTAQDLVKRNWELSERPLTRARLSQWGKVPLHSGAHEVLVTLELADALESTSDEPERLSRLARDELEGMLLILLAHEQVHVYQHITLRAFDITPANLTCDQALANITITEGHAEYVARQVAIQLGLARHWQLSRNAMMLGPARFLAQRKRAGPRAAPPTVLPSVYTVGLDHFDWMVNTLGVSAAGSRAYSLPRPNCGLLALTDRARFRALVPQATRDALAVENCALRAARSLRLLGERAWVEATLPRSVISRSANDEGPRGWPGELVTYVVETRAETAAPFERLEIAFSCFDSLESARRFIRRDALDAAMLFASVRSHATGDKRQFGLEIQGQHVDCVSFEGTDSEERLFPIGLAVFRLGPVVISIRAEDPAASINERLQECIELTLLELLGNTDNGSERTRSDWIDLWHSLSAESVLGRLASEATLAHPNHLVRLVAAAQSAQASSASAILAQSTSNEDWRLRWIAFERLLKLSAHDSSHQAALYRKAFNDRSAALVISAIDRALSPLDRNEIPWPEVRRALLQHDSSLQVRILRLLDAECVMRGPQDVTHKLCEVLRHIFDHGDEAVRIAALRSLGVLYSLPPAACGLLSRGLLDESRRAREMALTILWRNATPVRETLDPLLRLLEDPVGTDVVLIARVLGTHGADAAPALENLRNALASAKGDEADEIEAAIKAIEGGGGTDAR